MFKDMFKGRVRCDDERVGTLPTRLAFVEMSKFHQQGSKLLFWASSHIRHHNSTHFHSNKTLTESPRLLLRQPWNGVLTSFAIFLLIVWKIRAEGWLFLTILFSYVSSSAMNAAEVGGSASNNAFHAVAA